MPRQIRSRKSNKGLYYGIRPGLRYGDWSVASGTARKVIFPRRYGGIFSRGEKVLNMHFVTNNSRSTIQFFRGLKRDVKMLKQLGVAGVVGDTPNQAIAMHARRMGAVVIPTPRLIAWGVKRSYRKGIENGVYSSKYENTPVWRIIYRFP